MGPVDLPGDIQKDRKLKLKSYYSVLNNLSNKELSKGTDHSSQVTITLDLDVVDMKYFKHFCIQQLYLIPLGKLN